MTVQNSDNAPSPWEPLQHPVFRALWMASLASSIGSLIQDVGAAWLMMGLTTSPFLVALVQSADNFAICLLSVPSGALADLFDRRKILLLAQTWMFLATAAMALMAWQHMLTPYLLVVMIFIIGIGAALNMPAWQAITPELVPRGQLGQAVAVYSIGMNVARAIGPAIGGAMVAWAGPAAAFGLNAVSFLAVVAVLWRWKRQSTGESSLPAEPLWGAMQSGLHYIRYSAPMLVTLIRATAFVSFASAVWVLLPVVARGELKLGATGYGALLACLGLGAIGGAYLLPRLRSSLSLQAITAVSTFIFAATAACLGAFHIVWLVGTMLVAGGVAWVAVVSTLNVAAQSALPSWVRARGMAAYVMIFIGGMGFGGTGWGALAEHIGVSSTLLIAAAGLLLTPLLGLRYRLSGDAPDLTPGLYWPAPIAVDPPDEDEGPVLVTVDYLVAADKVEPFLVAVHNLRDIRLRDGAFQWSVYQDLAQPDRFIETYVVESWVDHLRQHERVTQADRQFEERVRMLHASEEEPVTRHYVARKPDPR